MKEYIAKLELLDVQENTIRVRVSTRNRFLRCSHAETLFPKSTTLYELLKAHRRVYVLLRANRQRQVHFVRQVEDQKW
jgi:hypothetical protein